MDDLKNPQSTAVKESSVLVYSYLFAFAKSLKMWLWESLILSVLALVTGYGTFQ